MKSRGFLRDPVCPDILHRLPRLQFSQRFAMVQTHEETPGRIVRQNSRSIPPVTTTSPLLASIPTSQSPIDDFVANSCQKMRFAGGRDSSSTVWAAAAMLLVLVEQATLPPVRHFNKRSFLVSAKEPACPFRPSVGTRSRSPRSALGEAGRANGTTDRR